MGGAEPVLVEGAGHDADATPDDVQMRVAGLVDVWAVVPPLPHALRRTKARLTTGAPARMRLMLLERWYLQMITRHQRGMVRVWELRPSIQVSGREPKDR